MSRSRKPFIEQLQHKLSNPIDGEAIRARIKVNERSRLFDDLPDHFYSIFDDFFLPDTRHLIDILLHAKAKTTDEGDVFTHEIDRREIQRWCKTIMHRGALQLLDEKNNINENVLSILDKKPNEITNRELICAYFAAINQCVMTYIANNSDELLLNCDDQFRAFIQFMNDRSSGKQTFNNFSLWAQEVLKERIDPSLCQNDKLDTGEKLLLGLGAGAAALLLFGGIAGGLALRKNNRHRPHDYDRDPDNNNSDHSPKPPGYNGW